MFLARTTETRSKYARTPHGTPEGNGYCHGTRRRVRHQLAAQTASTLVWSTAADGRVAAAVFIGSLSA